MNKKRTYTTRFHLFARSSSPLRPHRLATAALLALCALAPCGWAQEGDPPADKPQVRLEARILEWQISDSLDFDFSVQYSGDGGVLQGADLTLPANPTLSSASRLFFSDTSNLGTFDGVIEALRTKGTVKVLSEPSITLTSREADPKPFNADPKAVRAATDDQYYSARMSNTLRVPYERAQAFGTTLASVTEYRDTGVTMDVSVIDVQDALITLDLWTEVSELTGYINVGLNERNEPMRVPTIDSRSIQNRLIVPDRSVFIAGLIKTCTQTNQRSGIPWVGELPLLSTVLSNKHKSSSDTELVFLVKPEIVQPRKGTAVQSKTIGAGQ